MPFEWDEKKNKINIKKHNVSFETAQEAFFDPNRLIVDNDKHSKTEKRFYCIGKVNSKILTVRFTFRNGNIRIYGAGYWRRGKALYEKKN